MLLCKLIPVIIKQAFLEEASEALIEKETLLHSDIQKIREGTVIIAVAV